MATSKTRHTDELYSHHVFMLPFKWSKTLSKDSWLEAKDFEILVSGLPACGWEESQFDIDTILNYNEYHYFYDYVRDILYDKPDEKNSPKAFIRHFEFKQEKAEKGTYKIVCPKPGDKNARKTYELNIDSVLLHLYDTGVGVLSFHLVNRKKDQSSPEDILYINQFGRRVFPPFFGIPAREIGTHDQFVEKDFAGNLPAGKELAYSLEIELLGQAPKKETWSGYLNERLKPNSKFEFKLPEFLEPFLLPIEQTGCKIEPILDDRMFVVCWYGNKNLADGLAANGYASDDWWYKFVHVDSGLKTVQNDELQAQIIEKATNARWKNFGTFFGVTDYSLVMLTGELAHLRKKEIGAAFLVNHLQTIYYKMAELALVQRATVQKFSDEAADISKLELADKALPRKLAELHRRYIRFVNRIYFREVTAQVQGIELYDKLHEQSRLRDQVESLKQEIDELHTYVDQAQEMERNARLEQLTLLGTILLPPSLILAVYGVNTINEVNKECEMMILYSLAVFIGLSSLLSWFVYKAKLPILKVFLLISLIAIMSVGILSPLHFAGCEQCTPGSSPREMHTPKDAIPNNSIIDTTKNIQHEQ